MNITDAPFTDLRAAYLRAIAKAWNDERYLKKLVKAGDNGLALLEKDYKFTFTWDIKFCMKADPNQRPVWSPNEVGGWWGLHDLYEMWLPGKPDDDNDCASLLATYAQYFPTMLGMGREVVSGSRTRQARAPLLRRVPPSDYAVFGIITQRLIAATWANDAFAARLFAEQSPWDTVALVQGAMSYVFPWNFGIKFHRYDPIPRDASKAGKYWKNFPITKITVNIPEDPRDPEVTPPFMPPNDIEPEPGALQAVALAAYNGTGDQYPFSCA